MHQRFLRPLIATLSLNTFFAVLTVTAAAAHDSLKHVWAARSSSVAQQRPQNVRILEPGKPVERELTADETHVYRIRMAKRQFLRVLVVQHGIDVAVALIDPAGKQIVVLNSSDGDEGTESVITIAETPGIYQLGLRSVSGEAPAGRYEVKVEELRAATAKDFKLVAAERALLEAEVLRSQGTAESLTKSVEKYSQAATLYHLAGDLADEQTALNNLGSVYDDLGDKEKALEWYERALRLARDTSDRDGEAVTLNNIGTLYDSIGERRKALECYLEALPLRRALGDLHGESTTLSNIGAAYDGFGEKQKALDYYEQSLQLTRAEGDQQGEAVTLNNIGKIYSDLGEQQKAIEYYEKALPLHQAAENRVGEAATLTNFGAAYDAAGDNQKALDYYLKALPLLRAAGEPGDLAAALNNLGSVYFDLGDNKKALECYTESLSLSRDAGDRASEAAVLNNFGKFYDSRGQKQEALESIQQALTLSQAIEDRDSEATSFTNLGALYDSWGEKPKALEYYQKGLALHGDVGDPTGKVTVLNNIGGVYASLGDSQAALDWYGKALSLSRTSGSQDGEASSLNNMGVIYDRMGEKQKALEYFIKALPLAVAAGDRAEAAVAHNNLGALYVSLGDKPKALDHYLQAQVTLGAVGDRRNEAVTLNNIGRLYDDLGEKRRALDTFERVLQINQTLGNRGGEATAHNNIGGAYDSSGEKQKALEHYLQALQIYREVGDRGGQAVTLNNIGGIYSSSRDGRRSLEYYSQALELRRAVRDHIGIATTLSNIGVVYEFLGEKQRALDYYEQAVTESERIRATATLEEIKTGLAESSASTYSRIVLLAANIDRGEQAFNTTEHARARAFLDQLGNTRPRIHQNAAPALLREELELRSNIEALETGLRREATRRSSASDASRLEDELEAARQHLEELLTRIKLADPEYATLRSVETLRLPEVQNRLDKDTTLLSYFVTPTKTIAFVVTKDSLRTVEMELNEKALKATISSLLDFSNLKDSEIESREQLYNWLIAPIKKYVKTPVLGIIPHGVLHYMPFAALYDGRRDLGEQYTLFYLPSASVLPFIEEKEKRVGNSLLALSQSRVDGLPVLRYANEEARAIAAIYGTEATIGGSASKADFVRLAKDYNIIHLAAHAALNSSNPLFSYVALGDGEGGTGALSVSEIYDLDLTQARLIVLSACETQLGPYSKGDDIVGLNRAFIYAGTPTVIASLWSVDDEATNILMKEFYKNLKQGMGKAEALRSAQLATRKKYPHPYYWAGFILTGGH